MRTTYIVQVIAVITFSTSTVLRVLWCPEHPLRFSCGSKSLEKSEKTLEIRIKTDVRYEMKEHRSMDESLTYTSNRQQKRLIQEQRSPHSTVTTSAWNDGMKEELAKDNNNNLSVSSGRYANDSLWAGHSYSTTDCSSSPTSECSPRAACNDCTVPTEFTPHRNILDEYRLNRSISDAMRLSGVDTNVPRDTLQCPMCTFSTSNRLEFTNHLISCCTLKRDNDAAPRAVLARFPNRATERSSNEDDYSPTLRERAEREIDRSTIGLGDFSVDWQGDVKKQVKSFREGKCCKQCNYVANTKMEYWEHMRCHIKGFTCPKCSFVTKYKHHMNHHWLSVHDGSKPFKCKKCSYTCVSKSMLTSHLKKHSNVYPYRCANCTYKTKFCNALKKHLRKKGHEPAVVLNADGSPNPLSIIDVYGTKRGPKQRPSDKKRDESDQNEDVTTTNDDQSGSAGPISPVSPLESPVAAHSLATSTTNGTTNDTAGGSQSAMNQNRSIVTFPYSDLVAAFNLSNLLFREDVRGTAADYAQRSDVLLEYTKKMNYNLGNLVVPGSFVQNLAMTCFDGTDDNDNDKSETYANGNANDTIEGSSAFVTSRLPPIEAREDKSTNAPLDLRKTDVIRKNQFHLELSITDLPERTISSNRRKGKAVKLDRRLVEKYEEPANDAEFFESTTVGTKERKNCSYDKIEDDRRTIASLTDNRLICYYCEIAFGDAAMYSVHMGYHGFNDPYTCNMCGHQCTDRLSFFLHIGRSKHT